MKLHWTFFVAFACVSSGNAGCGRGLRAPGGVAGADLSFSFNGAQGDMASSGIDPGDLSSAGNDCPDNARLVYVVDSNNMLSSFNPQTLAFSDIGTLHCPASPGSGPFSMSIDRNAVAWVLYDSNELFFIDVVSLKCTASKWSPGQDGMSSFGMAFVADAPMAGAEHLFAASRIGGPGTGTLGRIDESTLHVNVLGPLGGYPDLTGTGDGKLWGFYPDAVMPRVSRIDTVKATESNTYKCDAIAGSPLAWAFTFWGGDFWIFLKRDGDTSTNVHRLRQNGQLTTVLQDTGRDIVGAGVSTCAPITIQ